MINHKFIMTEQEIEGFRLNDYNSMNMVRISDRMIQRMKGDLSEYIFTWSCEDAPRRKGLSPNWTDMDLADIKNFQKVLVNYSDEKEYEKLAKLVKCSIEQKMLLTHIGPFCVKHEFIVVDNISIAYEEIKNHETYLAIPDQFIEENYEVFSQVKMHSHSLEKEIFGFSYYGISILTPKQAQNLLDVMVAYIQSEQSEAVEYFIGEECDRLMHLLELAIQENKYVMHFGI